MTKKDPYIDFLKAVNKVAADHGIGSVLIMAFYKRQFRNTVLIRDDTLNTVALNKISDEINRSLGGKQKF